MKKNNYRLLTGSLVAILAWVNAGSVALAVEPDSRSVILRDGAKLSSAPESESGQPLALASADFDEDGVPDLITSYASAQGGQVSVRRGNVDAIYPNSPEAQARRQRGEFTTAAFLPGSKSFGVPEPADLIGAGDFDADGHWDVVTAHTGGTKLYWLRGDGRGNFEKAQTIELGGAVTALVTGEINRADGLTDVAVGIVMQDGARVLVFESPEGALRGAPESFSLPAPASALAVGQLDGEASNDLAIAAGNEVIIVHGRDRKLSQDAAKQEEVRAAEITRTMFDSAVTSIAIGDFAGDARQELAALTSDGNVRVLGQETTASGASENGLQVNDGMTLQAASDSAGGTTPARLLAAKVSSLPKDDLVLFGGSNDVRIVTTREADVVDGSGKVTKAGGARMSVAASLPSQSEVNAVLPMRLNADALKDLVLLRKDGAAPSVLVTQPAATYVVNATGNTSDVNPGNGVCLDNAGNCTFSAAIQEANAHAGADRIEFNIPGAGPHTVSPNFSQVFTDVTTIDGTTQPGSRIEVIGNGILPFEFTGNSSNSVVRGVATYSFGQNAITIRTAGNLIEGNYIGLRADGSAPVGEQSLVDADAELPGDGHRARRPHRRPHDGAEQSRLQRDGGAAALARHLGHRAAEVQVDVIDAALAHEHPHRLPHVMRVHPVELEAARRLLAGEAGHEHRLAVALDQGPRRDHLADVEPAPNRRHRVRKGGLVTPAMGARTTGGQTRSGPICTGANSPRPAGGTSRFWSLW